jgi:hypothetical protein
MKFALKFIAGEVIDTIKEHWILFSAILVVLLYVNRPKT